MQVASALHSQAWNAQHPRAFVVVSTVSELCSRNWKLMITMQPREKNSHWSRTYFSLATLTYFLSILGKYDLIALDLFNAEPYCVWPECALCSGPHNGQSECFALERTICILDVFGRCE